MEKEMVCEAFAKVVSELVEAEVSKVKSENQVNLESVIKFIRNAEGHEIKDIFDEIHNTMRGSELLDQYYEDRLQDDSSVISKDDIDVQTVDECGLLEDCYNEYLDNCYDLKETIKDMIDRL